jgi:DNA invertase Pin-like site-specific DNA recombinase|tara:strand:- start:162 stop:707 length:546 start_codon:yes stop_codon:yes gene_type:complete
MTDIGYVRVSSVDQNTDRQLCDVKLDKVFTDRCSGKDRKRPQLKDLMEWIRDSDTVHVHSIDRLARNLKDLQDIVETVTSKGVSIKFHKENLTFTGDDSPMQKLMLQMMGAFAEFERSMIRERQREGIKAAQAAGKQIGAKPKLDKDQIRDIRKRVKTGECKAALAREYSISRQTLYNSLS